MERSLSENFQAYRLSLVLVVMHLYFSLRDFPWEGVSEMEQGRRLEQGSEISAYVVVRRPVSVSGYLDCPALEPS